MPREGSERTTTFEMRLLALSANLRSLCALACPDQRKKGNRQAVTDQDAFLFSSFCSCLTLVSEKIM